MDHTSTGAAPVKTGKADRRADLPFLVITLTLLGVGVVMVLSASFASAIAIFSWPALVLGSIATLITGSGNSMDSRIIGALASQSVSPVVVFLWPTAAAISPE